MQTSNNTIKDVVDQMFDGVYFVDVDRRIQYWNAGAERLTGYAAADMVGSFCSDATLMHVNQEGCILCNGMCPLAASIADGKLREAEVFLHHRGGYRMPVNVRVAPLRDEQGNIIGGVEVFSDNTPKFTVVKKLEDLQRTAMLDSVTGLANRAFMQSTLEAHFQEFSQIGWRFGILFVDVDHFKAVNDTYGHDTGDAVLKMVAQTLSNAARAYDLVCRWGGEEFVILIANMDRPGFEDVANRFRRMVEQSNITAGDETVRVTASFGATLVESGDTPETIVKRADTLMYQSKSSGRNRVTFG